MGPVLCAVDGSEPARAALGVARELAERLGSDLVVVHVEPPTEAPGVSAAPAGQRRLREEELETARAFLADLAERERLDADVALRGAVGSPAALILELCERERASFVVLGSRGRGGLRSAVLGSVSHAVASRAPCPVVIVPPGVGDRGHS